MKKSLRNLLNPWQTALSPGLNALPLANSSVPWTLNLIPLTERAPLLRLEMLAVMMDMLQRVWRLRDLPTPVCGLLRGRRLQSLECSALRALLERKLPFSKQCPQADDKPYTSGVSPPETSLKVEHAVH